MRRNLNATQADRSAVSQRGLGFYTVRGGMDSGDHPYRPGVLGVVNVWEDLRSGDINSSSPGGDGSTNLSQSVIEPHMLGFPHHAERYQPGGSQITCRNCQMVNLYMHGTIH